MNQTITTDPDHQAAFDRSMHEAVRGEILERAKTLPPDELHRLAWELMDAAKIVVFVGVSVDDMRERIEALSDDEKDVVDPEDTDPSEISDEQILDAIVKAAESDWSDAYTAACDQIEELLGL